MTRDIQHVADVILTNNTFYNKSIINSVDCSNRKWYNNSAVNAFYNCQNLTQVTNLHENIKDFTNCFRECTNLSQVPTLPTGATNFAGCFYNCSNMQGTIGTYWNATNISNMFSFCRNVAINIPTLPVTINSMDYAFYFANLAVTSINIQNHNLPSLNGSFYACSKLVTPPKIPDSVVSMESAFRYCTNLQSIPTIPNNVTNLFMAFDNCTNLTNIANSTISKSAIDVSHAFENCINLTGDIYILSNKITRASDIFRNTTLPKNVYIPFTNSNNSISATYNAFIGAGYSETVAKDGVLLKDRHTISLLTVSSTPNTAKITLNYNGTSIVTYGNTTNTYIIPKNIPIEYIVTAPDYPYVTNTITLTEDNQALAIDLNLPIKTYNITYDADKYSTFQLTTTCIGVYNSTSETVNIAQDFIVEEATN